MRVLRGPWASWETQTSPTAVTVGVFDGVHLGHRTLIERLRATGHVPTILTFEPHPAEVLAPGTHPRLITTIDERLGLLAGAGVELVGVLNLAEIRHLQAGEFLGQVLEQRLAMAAMVVGTDFHFGRDRSGDVAFLRRAGDLEGFKVDVVELQQTADGAISSSGIRAMIEMGDMRAATGLLGSRYSLSNVVIHGDGRGREIGFPTANLEPPGRKVIPGHGVYAAYALLRGERHQAAVNVGVRPTFGGTELVVEAHLLDFNDDCYDETMTLEFVERLRPELRFEEVSALIKQMSVDVETVREVLESLDPGPRDV
ncbi:MAG TPA: bifunctional riboflavin kinase/FAD synthetase [Acidimicrobiia bacterium]|nr:bifunctional riboflavin kinase/FAD synthetase [Acidimicrobiia bacterium]